MKKIAMLGTLALLSSCATAKARAEPQAIAQPLNEGGLSKEVYDEIDVMAVQMVRKTTPEKLAFLRHSCIEKKDPSACNLMGVITIVGNRHVKASQAEAALWLHAACTLGHELACRTGALLDFSVVATQTHIDFLTIGCFKGRHRRNCLKLSELARSMVQVIDTPNR